MTWIWYDEIYIILVIALSWLSGLGYTYEISDGVGSGSSHSVRQQEYFEGCTRGPDGKGKNILLNWLSACYEG